MKSSKLLNPIPGKLAFDLPWPWPLIVYVRRLVILLWVMVICLIPTGFVIVARDVKTYGWLGFSPTGSRWTLFAYSVLAASLILSYLGNRLAKSYARKRIRQIRNLREQIRAIAAEIYEEEGASQQFIAVNAVGKELDDAIGEAAEAMSESLGSQLRVLNLFEVMSSFGKLITRATDLSLAKIGQIS